MNKVRTSLVMALATCLSISATSTLAQRHGKSLPPPPTPKPLSAEMMLLENEFKGKTIVLKQPLYTILSAEADERVVGRVTGGSNPVYATRRSVTNGVPTGLNTISPDKGMFFRFVEVGGPTGLIDISDGDPNRLKERVIAAKPAPPGATPPQLLTYGTGTKLRVRGFEWGGRIISILLDDQFADPGGLGSTTDRPTTSLTILWPGVFSPEFSERSKVEELIGQIADLERQ